MHNSGGMHPVAMFGKSRSGHDPRPPPMGLAPLENVPHADGRPASFLVPPFWNGRLPSEKLAPQPMPGRRSSCWMKNDRNANTAGPAANGRWPDNAGECAYNKASNPETGTASFGIANIPIASRSLCGCEMFHSGNFRAVIRGLNAPDIVYEANFATYPQSAKQFCIFPDAEAGVK